MVKINVQPCNVWLVHVLTIFPFLLHTCIKGASLYFPVIIYYGVTVLVWVAIHGQLVTSSLVVLLCALCICLIEPSLIPRSNFSHTQRMGRVDMWKIRPGIYCRGSCVYALAWNVTEKCTTEMNRLPCSLVWVVYTRTGTNMPMCELAEWHEWSYNYNNTMFTQWRGCLTVL